MTNTCAQCGRIYDPQKHHDCADRAAFTHGLDLLDGKVMRAKDATSMATTLASLAVEPFLSIIRAGNYATQGRFVILTRDLTQAQVDLIDTLIAGTPDPRCACGFPDRHTNLPCSP